MKKKFRVYYFVHLEASNSKDAKILYAQIKRTIKDGSWQDRKGIEIQPPSELPALD